MHIEYLWDRVRGVVFRDNIKQRVQKKEQKSQTYSTTSFFDWLEHSGFAQTFILFIFSFVVILNLAFTPFINAFPFLREEHRVAVLVIEITVELIWFIHLSHHLFAAWYLWHNVARNSSLSASDI